MKKHPARIAALVLSFPLALSAQQEAPREIPATPEDLPADAVIWPIQPLPPSLSGMFTPAGTLFSPAPRTNFLAIFDDGANKFPPDTQGAVGPSNVVTMLNTLVRIQDRGGGTNLTTTLSNWWGFAVADGSPFDPRIVYEPYNNRWIAAAVANPKATNSSVLIGVSQSSGLHSRTSTLA